VIPTGASAARLPDRVGNVVRRPCDDGIVSENPEKPFIPCVLHPFAQLDRFPEDPLILLRHPVRVSHDGAQKFNELRHLIGSGKMTFDFHSGVVRSQRLLMGDCL